MRVSDAIAQLRKQDGALELHEAALPHDFWRGMACTAMKVLRGSIKMNGEQSAAWDIAESLICGG